MADGVTQIIHTPLAGTTHRPIATQMDQTSAAAAELLELTDSDSPYGALAGFSIDKKIGKGQFSVVHRARANHDDKTVALKKVQIFEMMDSKARLDCMKEIQLLQVVHH